MSHCNCHRPICFNFFFLFFFFKDDIAASTPKSTRRRLKELGYPLLDEEKPIIKALKTYSQEAERNNRESITSSLTAIRRVLGYVDFMAKHKDDHGWLLLLETEKIAEYIRLLKGSGHASPSTAKNYCDKIMTVLKLTESCFFDQPGIPTDPLEVSTIRCALPLSPELTP